MVNPVSKSFTGLCCDLELYRLPGFLLHDHRTFQDLHTVGNVTYPELYQIAASEFTVDCQVEERKITDSIGDLESNPDSPDFLEF